jgi:hypothetical protein
MEILQMSSHKIDEWAQMKCSVKHKGGMEEWAKNKSKDENVHSLSCDWYHSTWQYMRLLNMVAVPNWYPFYVDAMGKILGKKKNANVFICACADYGMLAKLHEAIVSADANPTITIYDICETPLKSCEWYAEMNKLKVHCKVGNILSEEIPEAPFDLIVTDEFLTVLKKEYKPLIIERWKELLADGGKVVTTAMIGEETTMDKRTYYFEKATILFDLYKDVLFPEHTNGNSQYLIDKFERFAMYHTRHMIENENEIKDLFKGFNDFSCSIVTTPGECVNPTDSFQIVAG